MTAGLKKRLKKETVAEKGNSQRERKTMKLVKKGRKWIVEGDGEGWIFNKRFPTKWKAEIALKVFKKGGRVSDYWKEARRYAESRPSIEPKHVLKKLERSLEEIRSLDPTCDEVVEFAKDAEF